MCVKKDVEGVKMSVVDVNIADARRWSEFMLNRKSRGFRDRKMELAAHEAEVSWGAPASIMLRLVRRDVTDMMLSNWLAVKLAYDNCVSEMQGRADHQKFLAAEAGLDAANSGMFAAGVFLERSKDEATTSQAGGDR